MAHEIIIEDSIPMTYIPVVRKKYRDGLYHKLQEMQVGQSFVIPNNIKERTKVYNSIKHIRNFIGIKSIVFKSLKISDTERRFWKVSM